MIHTLRTIPKPPATPACDNQNQPAHIFDYPETTAEAYELCDRCPVQLWCLEIVNPANTWYDGVCGGLNWANGRYLTRPNHTHTPAQQHYLNQNPEAEILLRSRYKTVTPDKYDWIAIELLANNQTDWKQLTNGERRQAALIMYRQGKGISEIIETTHVRLPTLKALFELEDDPTK